MNTLMYALMGLIVGYVIGVGLAALFVFAFDMDGVARFIAIGCGLLGAVIGPTVARRLGRSSLL